MPKLHLKRTPEEEASRQFRKKKRKEAKKTERNSYKHPSRKPSRTNETSREWASSDDESVTQDNGEFRSSTPRHSRRHPSVQRNHIHAEIGEMQFRERMFDALGDDERLDALEARFNDYAHVPGRWRTSSPNYHDQDDFLRMHPRNMDDEEYTEWIRLGMYRRTHAAEHAEQERQKAWKAERCAAERARKLETRRLEKLAEAERKLKKLERERRRQQYAREEYELRWKELLSGWSVSEEHSEEQRQELGFHDIPWPALVAYRNNSDKRAADISLSLEHLTQEAIVDFLFPVPDSQANSVLSPEVVKKERKDKLRETLLRFHPDKFEGRIMKFIKQSERDAAREAVGQVARCLNALMIENN